MIHRRVEMKYRHSVEREQVSLGVTRQKGTVHRERDEALTGICLFRETVWLGRSILATDGRIVGCVVGI